MNKNGSKAFRSQWVVVLLMWIGLSLAAGEVAAAAKPKLVLNKVSWVAKKGGQLLIAGKLKNAPANTLVETFGIDGRPLGTSTTSAFSFTIPARQLASVPCSVRVQAGNLELVKAVAGNPNKACKQAPTCQITQPSGAISVKLGDPVTFTATATVKGKHPPALKYEWDFGGGAMGEEVTGTSPISTFKRPDSTQTTVKFVRDNSRYRVHFSAVDGSVAAMESRQYRCEDAVDVIVGTPPTDVPDITPMVTASRQSVPVTGKELDGRKGELVVLPYEDLTMQCTGDTRHAPDGYEPGEFRYGSLNAVVYQKDLKSQQRTDVKLRYAAASSATDPVGPDSINSTSQNWPLNSGAIRTASPLLGATIPKTDRWDGSTLVKLDFWFAGTWGFPTPPDPDQGYTLFADPTYAMGEWAKSVPMPFADAEHGRRMPGYGNPYGVNDPQDFTGYLSDSGYFQARWLPLTDVDDSGRTNPFPLLRVQAVDGNDQPLTTASGEPVQTDAVQTAGRDFHCRQCHAKGRIAADPNTQWQSAARGYSVWNDDRAAFGGWDALFAPPEFFDPADVNNQPSTNVIDQEYAAVKNSASLHNFYDDIGDGIRVLGYDAASQYGAENQGQYPCTYCHPSANRPLVGMGLQAGGAPYPDEVFPPPATVPWNYNFNYSMNMHKWHGQLQQDPGDPNKLLRDADGKPQRWDPAQGPNQHTLFPVKDSAGNPLPMEQNCLRCHAGQREQCYRDRMYTAGVTCYQCHGDMLAMGQAYPKSYPNSDGRKMRLDWYDEPDCGSCHTGSANVGKSNAKDFFSGGVRKLAFDETDPSATTRKVDWSNPDASRFAIPAKGVEVPVCDTSYPANGSETIGPCPKVVRFGGPLYRAGKDTHGNVPCGACHGGAHAVWPNRDPNANDNVTSLQLQGHTGQILECNVCHDANAFKNEKDLDGGRFMADLPTDSGVLGGPHNTHPINDPYWYRNAQDPNDTNHATSKSDGTTYGGWHNNYAQKPGKAGEDQCAACHGNDHLGTRLSRTPVDRVFDFSGFNMAKLKKAGFKKKVIKVAAGTPIGCNTCHSVATSCRNSPAGDQCGKPSEATTPATHPPPAFTAQPGPDATQVVPGSNVAYSYTPTVNPPTGNTFSLSGNLDQMKIDATTGTVTTPNWDGIKLPAVLPYVYTYAIAVNDGKGGIATQTVPVTFACPTGQVLGFDAARGAQGCVTNHQPSFAPIPLASAVVGQAYSFSIVATDADLQKFNYSLAGAPTGMTIGQSSGTLNWANPDQDASLTINVNDKVGGSASETVTLHVCAVGQTWGTSGCIANHAPVITSGQNVYGLDVGGNYSDQVIATDEDTGDTLTYTLYGAPAGMTVSTTSDQGTTTGTLTWTANIANSAAGFSFAVAIEDGKGGIVVQPLTIIVCPQGHPYDPAMVMCM